MNPSTLALLGWAIHGDGTCVTLDCDIVERRESFRHSSSALLVSVAAARAPSSYVWVPNDGVNTDRFHDPDEAARKSIDRWNAANGNASIYLVFDPVVCGKK